MPQSLPSLQSLLVFLSLLSLEPPCYSFLFLSPFHGAGLESARVSSSLVALAASDLPNELLQRHSGPLCTHCRRRPLSIHHLLLVLPLLFLNQNLDSQLRHMPDSFHSGPQCHPSLVHCHGHLLCVKLCSFWWSIAFESS